MIDVFQNEKKKMYGKARELLVIYSIEVCSIETRWQIT